MGRGMPEGIVCKSDDSRVRRAEESTCSCTSVSKRQEIPAIVPSERFNQVVAREDGERIIADKSKEALPRVCSVEMSGLVEIDVIVIVGIMASRYDHETGKVTFWRKGT